MCSKLRMQYSISSKGEHLIRMRSDSSKSRSLISKKSIKPAAGSPDFFEIKERLFELSDRILIKCSPLLDIEYCIRNFEHIHHIYVVSVDAEVKELLCLL